MAGDEAAVVMLVRAAQNAQATPMLVLETMSCLWAIMLANKVHLTRLSTKSSAAADSASIPAQHVRDGAVAMGDLPPLLSHLRESWNEGLDESTAIMGVCKAVEMAASGILVSLREAGAIAEGLDFRARARTPMIRTTLDSSHPDEDERNYESFKVAADMVAEREQKGSVAVGMSSDHQTPSAANSSPFNTFTSGRAVGIVRR